MFEQASRQKLRFTTAAGILSVEDLWDLPLASANGRVNLNSIAIGLHEKLQRTTVSFVEDDDKADAVLQLKFDVVKHVIDVRKQERKEAAAARDKAEQKQKILAIVARKQDEALEGKSLEELQGLLASL